MVNVAVEIDTLLDRLRDASEFVVVRILPWHPHAVFAADGELGEDDAARRELFAGARRDNLIRRLNAPLARLRRVVDDIARAGHRDDGRDVKGLRERGADGGI